MRGANGPRFLHCSLLIKGPGNYRDATVSFIARKTLTVPRPRGPFRHPAADPSLLSSLIPRKAILHDREMPPMRIPLA